MLGDSAPGLMGMTYAEGSGARLLRDPRHRLDLAFRSEASVSLTGSSRIRLFVSNRGIVP
jgi:hypothetical protein